MAEELKEAEPHLVKGYAGLKEREEKWRNVRTRLEARGGALPRERVPAGPADEEEDEDDAAPATARPSSRVTPRNIPIGGIQPRGRKKSSRRNTQSESFRTSTILRSPEVKR